MCMYNLKIVQIVQIIKFARFKLNELYFVVYVSNPFIATWVPCYLYFLGSTDLL